MNNPRRMDISSLLSPVPPEDDQGDTGERTKSAPRPLQPRACEFRESSTLAHFNHQTSSASAHFNTRQPCFQSSADEVLQRRPKVLTNSAHARTALQSDTDKHEPTSHGLYIPSPHRSPLKAPPNHQTLSNRSLAKITMDEVPTETPAPRIFDSNDLSEEELSTVTQLLSYLNEQTYAYDSHVQLINLLHKGFLTHVDSAGDDARSYVMLPELRQAREAMDSRFAVGETLWLDWLADETRLAKSSEERVDVIALLQRATQDEPASSTLWQMYIDWVEINYASCYSIEGMPQIPMDDDDKEVCRAVFTKDMLHEVLEQAARALRWRIDASHAIWNKYLAFVSDAALKKTPGDALPTLQEVEQLFLVRLQDPHVCPETTVQIFWPIASEIYGDQWESQMSRIHKSMEHAHAQIEMRNIHEHKLHQAIDSGDQVAIMDQYNRYFKWEKFHKQRAPFDKDLRSSLFERSLLQFPTHADLWIEYIDFVISRQPSSHNPSSSVLPLLERATRHCPWSGDLWARRILRSDYERRSYVEIEATKHRATNSALLDIGGMEDYLKVLVEWCSYLRRHAFSATANDDDKDTAEVGITMALEDMQEVGRKSYGDDFKGDPLFRLEQVQVKFLSQTRRMQDARAVWRSLVPSKKDSSDFWLKYWTWEITLWIHDRISDGERVETTETGPQEATAIVEEALSQTALDWPEKVADLYMDHFQHHECVEKVQAATIAVRDFRRKIAQKRAKEAEVQQVQYEAAAETQVGDKRKRTDDVEVDTDSTKKARTQGADADITKKARTDGDITEATDAATTPQDWKAAAQQKRDRENLSITLSNLPPETTAREIRSFLRGSGSDLSIVSIDIAPSNGQATSATIEFEQQEDMEFSRARHGRILNGNEVQVHSGSHSTLYVTNYPPAYDERSIRKLFASYGEITAVRFPSLKFNNRRRFCYVQFASHKQAKSAETTMDGKKLDGLHMLVAKISDPDVKKARSGAQAELREVFVKNINNQASEEDVEGFFKPYGNIESINLLKNVTGKRLGSGFVVFSTAEEAKKAIEEANSRPYMDRILQVTLSTPRGGAAPTEHAVKQDIIVKHEGPDVAPLDTHRNVRERQAALLNVPSTVSDARIVAEMEKYGGVVKIQLRREQSGAIVEFEDVKVAFSMSVGIDLPNLGPECKSGETSLLFNKSKTSQPAAMNPSTVSRPVQRGGRRGGLGFKRGGLPGSNGAAKSSRNNADFKAMFQ